jgi:aspartyl-tRNA(Asn)/glutamyl-tRNA(Gln) amidotransferase subunit B
MSLEFEAVIGLEVHVQLATETKIFCPCPARPPAGATVADISPNAHVCPVCAGHPGTLPVLNSKVLEFAARAGLALGCTINRQSIFARKNYFYPDLPKGYQISQYEKPVCEWGSLEIDSERGRVPVQIRRIHLEEDAGKSVHEGSITLLNFNRAGVPLVEIVSEPDLRSAQEAETYLRELHAIVTTVGICDGNLQEGNFRCDANVSIRPKGSEKLGTRTEIKNVNSFRFVEKAIEYEIARQEQVIRSGAKVVQETRLFDSDRGVTISMRSKEEAEDYRYFPDPDLVPALLSEEQIRRIRDGLPELPHARRKRYQESLGLTPYDAAVLTRDSALMGFYDRAVEMLGTQGAPDPALAKAVANFLTGEVARRLNDEGLDLATAALKPRHLVDIAHVTVGGVISSAGAKKVLDLAWKSGDEVSAIIDREGLKQVSDVGQLEPVVAQVFADFPAQISELRSGKDKVMGFLVGQLMKRTGGKANPALLQELIRKRLAEE